MDRLLITGASGLLGSNLARDLATRRQVFGVAHQHEANLPGVEMRTADLSVDGAAEQLLDEVRPELVIHCAAAAQVDACESDPEWALRLNRDMARRVARSAMVVGAGLIHISTDAVFDGRTGGYRESDPPSPVNVYGRSKLAGEQAVLEENPDALVVRTNIFGWNLAHKRNLAEWFLERIGAGERTPGFTAVWFSPMLVNHLTDVLMQLSGRANGILHVAGRTCLSKYEFGRKLAERFGYDPQLIEPALVDDAKLDAERGSRLCLDCGLAESILGREMPSVQAGIDRFWELRDRGTIALRESSVGR